MRESEVGEFPDPPAVATLATTLCRAVPPKIRFHEGFHQSLFVFFTVKIISLLNYVEVNAAAVIIYQYRRMKEIMKKNNLKMVSQYENPINILSKNEDKLFVRH